MARIRCREHDKRDIACLFKDMIREDAIELCAALSSTGAPTQRKLKIAERITAWDASDMQNVARIDKCDEEVSHVEGVSLQCLQNTLQLYLRQNLKGWLFFSETKQT